MAVNSGAVAPSVQIDQFTQGAMPGDLDQTIADKGVITGELSASVTNTLVTGTRVLLDSAYTGSGVPHFVACADNAAAHGVIKRTAQKSGYTGGDVIEVVLGGKPNIMWMVAGSAVTPGLPVEVDSTPVVGQTLPQPFVNPVGTTDPSLSNKQMGLALDYAVQSALVRVILGFVAC